MKVLVLFLCVLVGAYALPTLSTASSEWQQFKDLHQKVYKNVAEELLRLKIYLQNKVSILAHNIRQGRSADGFKVKMNKFGDLLKHEYQTLAGGRKLRTRALRAGGYYVSSGRRLPASVDLRSRGLVNTPKNQGSKCGSCWSFSTTSAIEGAYAKKTGRLINLSMQNLIDCSKLNGGCKGGYESVAFDYVRDNGVQLYDSYPYEARQGRCRANNTQFKVQIKGYQSVRPKSDADLMDALDKVGPVCVGIDATSDMFSFYDSGVFAPPAKQCTAEHIDHAVLAVGYGSQNGRDYWLIKNSWGTDWGEGGYVKVWRNGANFCGITTDPLFPLL